MCYAHTQKKVWNIPYLPASLHSGALCKHLRTRGLLSQSSLSHRAREGRLSYVDSWAGGAWFPWNDWLAVTAIYSQDGSIILQRVCITMRAAEGRSSSALQFEWNWEFMSLTCPSRVILIVIACGPLLCGDKGYRFKRLFHSHLIAEDNHLAKLWFLNTLWLGNLNVCVYTMPY